MTEQDLELIARRNIEFQLSSTLAATSQKLEAAIALLHKLEWSSEGDGEYPALHCPTCHAHSSDPAHKPGCELKALLDAGSPP